MAIHLWGLSQRPGDFSLRLHNRSGWLAFVTATVAHFYATREGDS